MQKHFWHFHLCSKCMYSCKKCFEILCQRLFAHNLSNLSNKLPLDLKPALRAQTKNHVDPVLFLSQFPCDSNPTYPYNLWTLPCYRVINMTPVTIYYNAICHEQGGYCSHIEIYSVCTALLISDLALYDPLQLQKIWATHPS